jgi:hypothetical protein
MSLYNEIGLFILSILVMYHITDNSPDKLNKTIFVALLGWVCYLICFGEGIEPFLFQVTPWKTTCANNPSNRCPQCCGAGFYGQNVGFDYISDADRLALGQRGCSFNKLKNNPNDYYSLQEYNEHRKENFCTSCSDHKALSGYGSYTTPGQPQGLQPKALGNNQLIF